MGAVDPGGGRRREYILFDPQPRYPRERERPREGEGTGPESHSKGGVNPTLLNASLVVWQAGSSLRRKRPHPSRLPHEAWGEFWPCPSAASVMRPGQHLPSSDSMAGLSKCFRTGGSSNLQNNLRVMSVLLPPLHQGETETQRVQLTRPRSDSQGGEVDSAQDPVLLTTTLKVMKLFKGGACLL